MNHIKNSEQKNIKFKDELWPPNSYFEQLKNLYKMLDKPVYIIPLQQNQSSLTFSLTGKAIVLIAIIDYPNPDPENHMYPHMLMFNDGTGINLTSKVGLGELLNITHDHKTIIQAIKSE